MRLGDRLQEVGAQSAALEGADQPQAGGGQADAKTRGSDEKGMHGKSPLGSGAGRIKQRQTFVGDLAFFVGGDYQDGGRAGLLDLSGLAPR